MRKNINNKVVSIVVALALVCGVVMSAFAANDYVNPTFTDVPKSHWAYTFVEKAVEKGWVSGMGDGTFAPNANVTYSQFCVMLVRAFYNEDYESYDGPKGAWYVPFTTIASQKGLLDGEENNRLKQQALKDAAEILDEDIEKICKVLAFHRFTEENAGWKDKYAGCTAEKLVYLLRDELSTGAFDEVLGALRGI